MAEDSSKQTKKKAEVVELLKRFEEGSVPDEEIRRLMRIQLERRLQWGYKPTYQQQLQQNLNLVHSLRQMGIATESAELHSQLYEMLSTHPDLHQGQGPRDFTGSHLMNATDVQCAGPHEKIF